MPPRSNVFSRGLDDMPRLAVRFAILAVFAGLSWLVLSRLRYHWDWSAVWAYRSIFLDGLGLTLAVSVVAITLGLCFGLLSGLASVSGNIVLSELAALYVGAFRGTPLLVQILIFYFCVGVVVRVDSPFIIGTFTLSLFSGAYISEMVRAGVESVDHGQWEAAVSSGMTRGQALLHVVLPQAARRIVAPVTGQFVSCIKDSSLLSVISLRELTKAAEVVNASTYRTFETYLPLALLYLLLTWPLSHLTRRLERGIRNGMRETPR